jgi:hypothetical protein
VHGTHLVTGGIDAIPLIPRESLVDARAGVLNTMGMVGRLRRDRAQLLPKLLEFEVDTLPLLLRDSDVGSRLVSGALDLIVVARELGGKSNASPLGWSLI